MKLGFIGLGNLGYPLAMSLVRAGHDVTVSDLRRLELGSMTRQIFERARNLFGGEAWSPQVVKMLEDACGQPLRAPGFPETLVAE